MHEYGAGVPEDLALAKRNYDKALQYLPGAAAPVQAALLSLWLHGGYVLRKNSHILLVLLVFVRHVQFCYSVYFHTDDSASLNLSGGIAWEKNMP